MIDWNFYNLNKLMVFSCIAFGIFGVAINNTNFVLYGLLGAILLTNWEILVLLYNKFEK